MLSETFSINPERMSRLLAWTLWSVATLLMLVSARQVEMALSMSTGSSGFDTWLVAFAIVAGLFWCQLATVYFAQKRVSTFYSVLYSVLTFLLAGLFNVWAFTLESTFGSLDWGVSCLVGLLVPFLAFLANQVAAQCYLIGTGSLDDTPMQVPTSQDDEVSVEVASPVSAAPVELPDPVSSEPEPVNDSEATFENAHSFEEQEQSDIALAEFQAEGEETAFIDALLLEAKDEQDESVVAEIDSRPAMADESRPGAVEELTDEVLEPVVEQLPVIEESEPESKPVIEPPEPGLPVNVDIDGRHVLVLVERQTISNSRRKKLHEQLRRIATINWDKADKVETRSGKVFWTLGGEIIAPDIKGKKSKKKRQAAMDRHVRAVSDQLYALIGRYQKT